MIPKWTEVKSIVRLWEYRGLWTSVDIGESWFVLEACWVPEWSSWGYVLVSRTGCVPYREIPPARLARIIRERDLQVSAG